MRKEYNTDMIADKLRTEIIRLRSELSDALNIYKERDELTDDELIAQGWLEATEHFDKLIYQYKKEEHNENN
jgi:hypothetical protein